MLCSWVVARSTEVESDAQSNSEQFRAKIGSGGRTGTMETARTACAGLVSGSTTVSAAKAGGAMATVFLIGALSRTDGFGASIVVTSQQQPALNAGAESRSVRSRSFAFEGQQHEFRASPSCAHRYHTAAWTAVGARTSSASRMSTTRRTMEKPYCRDGDSATPEILAKESAASPVDAADARVADSPGDRGETRSLRVRQLRQPDGGSLDRERGEDQTQDPLHDRQDRGAEDPLHDLGAAIEPQAFQRGGTWTPRIDKHLRNSHCSAGPF